MPQQSKPMQALREATEAWERSIPDGITEVEIDHLFSREITQDVLGNETETLVPLDVTTARTWLKAQLGSIVVQPGRAIIEERVSLKEAA